MKSFIVSFLRDEQGQDLIEYTLLLAFVCLAANSRCSSPREAASPAFGALPAAPRQKPHRRPPWRQLGRSTPAYIVKTCAVVRFEK